MFLVLTLIALFNFYQKTTSECQFYSIFNEGTKGVCESCLGTEKFNCNKYISFSKYSTCYLFDFIALSQQFYRGPVAINTIYLKNCDENIPSISYIEFVLIGPNVTKALATNNFEYTRLKTEPECLKDCYSENCNDQTDSTIIAPKIISECIIYDEIPNYFKNETNHLLVKKCFPEQKNIEYTDWSECNQNCTQFKVRRNLLEQKDSCSIPTMPVKIIQTCTGELCPDVDQETQISFDSNYIERNNLFKRSTIEDLEELFPCIYGNWSEWDECNENCTQSRNRTLIDSNEEFCNSSISETYQMQSCTGGKCPSELTTSKAENTTDGCIIYNVDFNSRPSLKYKTLRKNSSCSENCKLEKKFNCQAYLTAGPGTNCMLFDNITRPIMVVTNSKYYLQDLNCQVGKSNETAICSWKKEEKKVSVKSGLGYSNQYKNYMTGSAFQCEQLCNIEHSLSSPNRCGAWIYETNSKIDSPSCYLLRSLKNDEVTSFDDGTGDLYTKRCSLKDETNAK